MKDEMERKFLFDECSQRWGWGCYSFLLLVIRVPFKCVTWSSSCPSFMSLIIWFRRGWWWRLQLTWGVKSKRTSSHNRKWCVFFLFSSHFSHALIDFWWLVVIDYYSVIRCSHILLSKSFTPPTDHSRIHSQTSWVNIRRKRSLIKSSMMSDNNKTYYTSTPLLNVNLINPPSPSLFHPLIQYFPTSCSTRIMMNIIIIIMDLRASETINPQWTLLLFLMENYFTKHHDDHLMIAEWIHIRMLANRKEMASATNAILTGLAVADLLVMIDYIPFSIHTYVRTDQSEEEKYSFGWAIFTLFHAHLSVVCHSISTWLTVILAVWRYTSVRWALHQFFPSPPSVRCEDFNGREESEQQLELINF